MSHLYFNEKSDYSEENTTCDNEVFRSTILHHRRNFRFITYSIVLEQKILIGANANIVKTKREK